ncbi:hypothetical protein, partial [Paracidovorax citrulli]|uniref:hypothetical protein n=1 Tax=Paracidovorax citrulli TaxID=80869 RepID=UPI0036729C60
CCFMRRIVSGLHADAKHVVGRFMQTFPSTLCGGGQHEHSEEQEMQPSDAGEEDPKQIDILRRGRVLSPRQLLRQPLLLAAWRRFHREPAPRRGGVF